MISSKNRKSLLKKLGFHMEREAVSIDLVCGMEVDPSKTRNFSVYKEKKYFFCSQSCKKHFDKDPEKYVGE